MCRYIHIYIYLNMWGDPRVKHYHAGEAELAGEVGRPAALHHIRCSQDNKLPLQTCAYPRCSTHCQYVGAVCVLE